MTNENFLDKIYPEHQMFVQTLLDTSCNKPTSGKNLFTFNDTSTLMSVILLGFPQMKRNFQKVLDEHSALLMTYDFEYKIIMGDYTKDKMAKEIVITFGIITVTPGDEITPEDKDELNVFIKTLTNREVLDVEYRPPRLDWNEKPVDNQMIFHLSPDFIDNTIKSLILKH